MAKLASRIRDILLVAGLFALLFGSVALDHVRAQPAVDSNRIGNLETQVRDMHQYGDRLTTLEVQVREITEGINEIKSWSRWIGGALLLAVLDRLLRRVGLQLPGMGG